jgi:endogenous inhibitor of DNA gyrase (YacG/DUF329 family)
MNTVRFTCPGCHKDVETPQLEVARPRSGKKDDPLVLIRATCPECGKVVQVSRLK